MDFLPPPGVDSLGVSLFMHFRCALGVGKLAHWVSGERLKVIGSILQTLSSNLPFIILIFLCLNIKYFNTQKSSGRNIIDIQVPTTKIRLLIGLPYLFAIFA